MFAALALVLAVGTAPACAQSELVDGQVTKIDQSAGKITIKHGPIKKFDMDDGMTMVFRARDPAMLKAVKAGDKVKFEAERDQRPVHRHQDREGEIATSLVQYIRGREHIFSPPSLPLAIAYARRAKAVASGGEGSAGARE